METTPDLVMALAAQLAEQMLAAKAAQDSFSWLAWVLGFARKFGECAALLVFGFWFLLFLDRRNAKRTPAAEGVQGFSWVLAEIRKGNVAVSLYFGLRIVAVLGALALIWARA